MKGVYCDGKSIAFRGDLPEPAAASDETRLAVEWAGICDTDLQLAKGYMGFRGVLGHEFVGRDESGRRFTAEINNSCHKCADCRAGRSNHCRMRTVLGIVNHDGAMAESVCVPTRNLHQVPDEIADRDAVFIEPLAAALRITEQVAIDEKSRVAVLGDGKLGILCAWVMRSAGARTCLIGKHREKLKLAGIDVETALLEDAANFGREFDVVVDATGSSSGLASAFRLVRPMGTVVLKTTIAGEHSLSLAPVVIDEVTVIGSRCGPFARAIETLARKRIDVEPLIGDVFPLDRAEAAFQAAAIPGARKVLLRIGAT